MIESSIKKQKGFTLLELLIVIAIIAILSVVLIFALNPAEALKRSRDIQRISDLNTLKSALTYYATATSTPDFDWTSTTICLGLTTTGTANVNAKISYSLPRAGAAPVCNQNVAEGTDVHTGSRFQNPNFCRYTTTSAIATAVDGTGWIPTNLTKLTGGSPIPNLPMDPVNTIQTITAPTSTDLVYRFACQNNTSSRRPKFVFEIDAQLESAAYTVTDDRRKKDGGDNPLYYEVGTSLRLLGPVTAAARAY